MNRRGFLRGLAAAACAAAARFYPVPEPAQWQHQGRLLTPPEIRSLLRSMSEALDRMSDYKLRQACVYAVGPNEQQADGPAHGIWLRAWDDAEQLLP